MQRQSRFLTVNVSGLTVKIASHVVAAVNSKNIVPGYYGQPLTIHLPVDQSGTAFTCHLERIGQAAQPWKIMDDLIHRPIAVRISIRSRREDSDPKDAPAAPTPDRFCIHYQFVNLLREDERALTSIIDKTLGVRPKNQTWVFQYEGITLRSFQRIVRKLGRFLLRSRGEQRISQVAGVQLSIVLSEILHKDKPFTSPRNRKEEEEEDNSTDDEMFPEPDSDASYSEDDEDNCNFFDLNVEDRLDSETALKAKAQARKYIGTNAPVLLGHVRSKAFHACRSRYSYFVRDPGVLRELRALQSKINRCKRLLTSCQ